MAAFPLPPAQGCKSCNLGTESPPSESQRTLMSKKQVVGSGVWMTSNPENRELVDAGNIANGTVFRVHWPQETLHLSKEECLGAVTFHSEPSEGLIANV